MRFTACFALLLALAACGDDSSPMMVDPDAGPPATDAGPMGLPLLGAGAHTADAVGGQIVATADDALEAPRDLAFHPENADQLWIVNGNTSMTILTDVGSPEQEWWRRNGSGSQHFFSNAAALAFGAPGFLASAQEQDEVTQPDTPPDFMGPTLWTSDFDEFDAGHASHYDMLHNSPSSVGIAWERDNVYWVFDGAHGSLTRYDFQMDHGPGGEDHSDGIVQRYVEGQVARVEGVTAGMEVLDGTLFVADTGNGRVARLLMASGTEGAAITPNYDGTRQFAMEGATLEDVVPAGTVDGLTQPAGLEIEAGVLYVVDHASSRVFGFSLEGELLDWVDLSSVAPAGSLMGLTFHGGALYLADAGGSRVLRVAAR